MEYSRLALYYDMFIDEDLYKEYLALIKPYHKETSVLDLGCGTGYLAIELAKHGYFVTATDKSTEMLEMAYNNALIEDVKLNFYIHDIIDTVNRDYDVITMSSDVINYMLSEDEVQEVFKSVSLAMNVESIFVFDALRPTYLQKLNGHHEEILLPDNLFIWDANLTNIENQIKHTVKIGNDSEVHIQQTYLSKEYIRMLKAVDLTVVKKVRLEERIIYVCKKEI